MVAVLSRPHCVFVFVFDQIFASVFVFVFETREKNVFVFVFDKTYLTPALINKPLWMDITYHHH